VYQISEGHNSRFGVSPINKALSGFNFVIQSNMNKLKLSAITKLLAKGWEEGREEAIWREEGEGTEDRETGERRSKIGEGAMMGSLTKHMLAISLTYF
jgi:hypothetical protein